MDWTKLSDADLRARLRLAPVSTEREAILREIAQRSAQAYQRAEFSEIKTSVPPKAGPKPNKDVPNTDKPFAHRPTFSQAKPTPPSPPPSPRPTFSQAKPTPPSPPPSPPPPLKSDDHWLWGKNKRGSPLFWRVWSVFMIVLFFIAWMLDANGSYRHSSSSYRDPSYGYQSGYRNPYNNRY